MTNSAFLGNRFSFIIVGRNRDCLESQATNKSSILQPTKWLQKNPQCCVAEWLLCDIITLLLYIVTLKK